MPEKNNGDITAGGGGSGGLDPIETILDQGVLDSHKQTIPVLNDFLQKQMVLVTALIGGGFLVAKGDVISHGWAIATMILLVSSLSAILYGLMPTKGNFDPKKYHYPTYRKWELGIIGKKSLCAWIASAILILSFVVGIIGMFVRDPVSDANKGMAIQNSPISTMQVTIGK